MPQRPASAMARLPSSTLPGSAVTKDNVVASGVTKDISRRLKSSGGHVLKSWLERKGVLMEATITKKQREDMKTVFELFDVGGNGVISSEKILTAFELLNAKPSCPISEIQSAKKVMVDFEEFERKMIKLGYGERDVLAELYFSDRNEAAERRNRERIPPDLLLMRERRERTLKSIFKDHIHRQKQIFGESNADVIQLSETLQVAEPKESDQIASSTVGPDLLAHSKARSTHRLVDKPSHQSDGTKLLAGFSFMVIQARGFPPNPRLRMDSWVQIKYGEEIHRTKIQRNTTTPSWNATFRFNVPADDTAHADHHVHVSLCLGETFKEFDVLGSGAVSISQVHDGFGGWLSIRGDKTRELLHVHHRPEVYVSCTPLWKSKYWAVKAHESAAEEDQALAELAEAAGQRDRIAVLEKTHLRQMQRLQAWERGEERPEATVSAAVSQRQQLYVAPHCPLFALCSRILPTSLAAGDVMAKLATPFAKEFKTEALDPKVHDYQKWRGLNAPIKVIAGMRTGQIVRKVKSSVGRVSVGGAHCLGLDREGSVLIWGDPGSKMLRAAGAGAKKAHDGKHGTDDTRALAQGGGEKGGKRTVSKAADDLMRRVLGGNAGVHRQELGSHPSVVSGLEGVAVFDVACGTSHSVVLSKDGEVYSWGAGDFGKLGHGGLWDEKVPRLVGTIAKRRTIQIACGANHTVAVTDNGALWSWGDGRFGQLGHGLPRDCGVPTKVKALEEVVGVACGSDHTVAMLADGQVFSWGMGWYGQLGHERAAPTNLKTTTRRAANTQSMRGGALRTGGLQSQAKPHHAIASAGAAHAHVAAGRASHKPPGEAALSEVLERLEVYEATIGCDLGHQRSSFADDQRAHCAMAPQLVQALVGVCIRKIACGSRHSVAYQSEGNRHAVWTWGDGQKGQLGHGQTYSEFVPRKVQGLGNKAVYNLACGDTWTAVLLTEESAMVWGELDYGKDVLDYEPARKVLDTALGALVGT